MAQPTTITSWSFSRWNTWEECGYKAKLKFLEKLPEPGSPAMDRGNLCHKALENYIKGYAAKLVLEKPCQPKAFGKLFKQLRDQRKASPSSVFVEDTFAFRSDWSETTWDSWDDCWLRVKIDCGAVNNNDIALYDWKTGRFREQNSGKYATQLGLYALGTLIKFPGATVTPSLVYLDEGIQYSPRTYNASDLPKLRKEWEARVAPMLKDKRFDPKPNSLCRFCTFRKDNGGPCKY